MNESPCTPSDAELELRLRSVERALRTQRLIMLSLAALALVGVLSAFRRADPDVVRAQRFEVVDTQGRTVGAFGIGGAALRGGRDAGEGLGWYLRDPESEAVATVFVGAIDEPESKDRVPGAGLILEGAPGLLQAVATGKTANLEMLYGEEPRSAALAVEADRTAFTLGAPRPGEPAGEPSTVLKLQHTKDGPTIQGWDETGNVAIDIK